MQEVLHFAFSGAMLPLTILLLVVVGYWLLVILGVLDIDLFDVDLDVDADVDIDVELEVDVDADVDADVAGGGLGGMQRVLAFLNLGIVPFMVVFSLFLLCLWLGAMLGLRFLGNATLGYQIGLWTGIVVLSLLVTKILTMPLRAIFLRLNAEESVQIIGKECYVRAGASHERLGQAEVTTGGAPLLLNVKTIDVGDVVRSGDHALVIAKSEDGSYYLIEPHK